MTNSRPILDAADQSFFPSDDSTVCPDVFIKLWVDELSQGSRPWPKPHVRGTDHLVYLGFDAGSSIAVNLNSRRIIGRVSPQFAADAGYWNRVVFPMLLSVIAGSAGVVELHCACVAHGGEGLLLAGPSRSGKSTLAVALGSLGFRFLSDDRTLCSLRDERLYSWSLSGDLKLRSEARAWFPELSSFCDLEGGERETRLDPEHLNRMRRARICKPCWLIFLDRQDTECFHLTSMSRKQAVERLEADLMAEFPETIERQSKVISALVNLPCSLLRYGGSPWAVAPKLAAHFEDVLRSDQTSNISTGFASPIAIVQ
jgi:hypothetical protein